MCNHETQLNGPLWLVGMLFFCSLTAAISTSMMQYFKSKSDQTNKIVVLRRLLHQKGINSKVSVRVQKDVPALSSLSLSVLKQLKWELRSFTDGVIIFPVVGRIGCREL